MKNKNNRRNKRFLIGSDDDGGGGGGVRSSAAAIKRRKTDRDFGPGTIVSDDEVENYSGSDSEAEDVVRYKKRNEEEEIDFYKDFQFVESVSDYMKDPWEEVIKMMKEKNEVNIDKTIARVRSEEEHKWRVKKKGGGGGYDSGSDVDTERELARAQDELVLREDEVQRKARQQDNPKKIVKTPQEIKQEEEAKKFFEDAPPCQPDATFLEMNFSRSLLKAIDRLGYDQPTPIQAATIPVALQGRDICGCAATGTGKTAAYMLPILERLLFKPSSDVVTRVLVVVPTRELGVQVFQVAKDLSLYSQIQVSLSVGGMDLTSQEIELKKAPDIVIATPGRLIDHLLNTPSFNLDSIEILVLDEADRMLDDAFSEQMNEIIKQCSGERQTMLFSATMTSQVKELAMVSLRNPVKVFVNENTDVARNLRQEFVRIRQVESKARPAMLAYLVSRAFREHCMVFVATKALAHHLNILLGLMGLRSGELHGDLKQAERLSSLKKFKDEEIDILIATDVAARGLDIKGVKTVINYTMPRTYKQYVHRVGRTARSGLAGRSVSLAGDHEFSILREIKKYSKTAMYERKLITDILNKYMAKVKKLSPAVNRVLVEEKEEKMLKRMEQNVAAMERKVNQTFKKKKDGGKDEQPEQQQQQQRSWFLSKEDIVKAETKKMVEKGKRVIKEQKLKKAKQKKRNSQKTLDPAQREMRRAVREGVLKVKKAGRSARIRAVVDDDDVPLAAADKGPRKRPKKNKNKSNFDKELTSTDTKSIKKFRSGPSYNERKQDFELNNPGKKFKPSQVNKKKN